MLAWFGSLSGDSVEILRDLLNWPGPQNYDTWGILANYFAFAVIRLCSGLPILLKIIPMALHTVNAFLIFKLALSTLETIPNLYKHKQIAWLPLVTALLFVSNPLAPEAVAYLGGIGYNLGCTLLLIAFLLYLKGKGSLSWTCVGLGWILFLLTIICDRSLWSAGFGIVAYELAKTHIGEAALHKKDAIPEKHRDAVDDMLEDVERHFHEHKRSQEPPADATTADASELEGDVEARDQSLEGEINSDSTLDTNSSDLGDTEYDTTPKPDSSAESGANANTIHPDSHLILFDSLVPALPFVILGSLIPLGALPQAGNESFSKEVIITSEDYLRVLGGLFFPINGTLSPQQTAWSLFTTAFAIGGFFLPIALGGSRKFRQNFAFLSGWLLLLIVPHLHGAFSGYALSGSRFLYNTLLPACGLISLMIFAPVFALFTLSRRKTPHSNLTEKPASMIITIVLAIAIMLQYGALSFAQNFAYQHSAEKLRLVQTEIASQTKKNQVEFVLTTQIPQTVCVAPVITPSSVCMFDSESALLRAPRIPSGQLRERVKEGSAKLFHWRPNNSLDLLDPAFLTTPSAPPLNGDNLLRTVAEGTQKDVIPDAANGALRLKNIVEKDCPALTLQAKGKNLLSNDFLYVDAKIWPAGKPSGDEIEKQWIELCWSTENGGSIGEAADSARTALGVHAHPADCKMSGCFSKTRAAFKDDSFHRYYLPVRASGWLSGDRVGQLRLLFPAKSIVWVKEVGTTDGAQRVPKIAITKEVDPAVSDIEVEPSNAKRYSCLCFDYPQKSELGTIAIYGNRARVAIDYDASQLSEELREPAGCVCEVNEPGKWFDNPNGEEFQAKVLKTIDLEKIAGRITLTASELKRPGIYSIRIFARDKKGAPVGNASDEVICLFDSNARP